MHEFVVAKKTRYVIKACWEAGLGKDIWDHWGKMFVTMTCYLTKIFKFFISNV